MGYKMPRSQSRQTKPTTLPTSLPRNQPASIANTSLHVEQPTFGQTMKQGFGFGAGSAIAHNMIGALLTPSISAPAPSDKKVTPPCEKELLAYQVCLKTMSSDDFCGHQQTSFTQCLQTSNLN